MKSVSTSFMYAGNSSWLMPSTGMKAALSMRINPLMVQVVPLITQPGLAAMLLMSGNVTFAQTAGVLGGILRSSRILNEVIAGWLPGKIGAAAVERAVSQS